MERFKNSLLSRLEAKVKIKLGVDCKADIQEKTIENYNTFLTLKSKVDSRAKEKVNLNQDLEVEYNWTDIDNKKLENKVNLQILRNQIEVLKRQSTKIKEVTNAILSYNTAFEKAIADYVNGGSDQIINVLLAKIKRFLNENKYNAFNSIETFNNYEELNEISEKVEVLKVKLENSEEWERAHKSREIAKRK